MSKIDYWEQLKSLKLLSLQRRRERCTIIHHGKKKCDLRDPGSLLKALSSCTIENWPGAVCAYLPCCNHVKYEIVSGIILLCGH